MTGPRSITVKSPKALAEGRESEATFEVDLGDDLDDAIEKFGGDVVYGIFVAQGIIKAQSVARSLLDKVDKDGNAMSSAEVTEKMESEWTPAASMRAPADPVKRLARTKRDMGNMDTLELQDLLKDLQAKLGITDVTEDELSEVPDDEE